MANLRVVQDSLAAFGESTQSGGIANRLGQQVVMDFYTYSMLAGKGFQVRAGTITTPLVGDVVITDTAAEMCVDAASGYTVLPVAMNISVRLGTGTLHEYAVKSVGTASSAGTAYTPLPLRSFGKNGATAAACNSTARVAAAGGVTVTAELATTTRRHWSWSNPLAAGAGNDLIIPPWEPRTPPPIVGPFCLYVQVAATTTGPSYYANLDFLEFESNALI